MKSISVRQLAAIKRVAQNVNLAVTKRNRLGEAIKRLNDEYNALSDEIEGHEVGVRALTRHTSEELVVKVVKETGKLDKDGKAIKTTSYEPIGSALVFNEKTRMYDLVIDEPEIEHSPVDPNEVDDSNTAYQPEGNKDGELPWAGQE